MTNKVTSDILVEIPDEDLPQVAEIYKQHVDWAPQVYNTINMGIQWKKSEQYRKLITFLSPNCTWTVDGTIVVLMEYSCYQLFLFTLDKTCKNLYKGLMNTKIIDFSKEVLIYNLYEEYTPAILDFIKQKDLEIFDTCRSVIYLKSPEEAKAIKIEGPSEIHIRKLDPSDSHTIDSLWPYRYAGSQTYISILIEMNGGYGIFLKGQLVSWAIKHCLAGLGMVQTVDGHKGKGYGSLITQVLTKDLGENGQWTYGTVVDSNMASHAMFKKLKFKEAGFIRNFSVKSKIQGVMEKGKGIC